jgi:DNA-3-methyladenine glycosylase I
MASTRLAKGLKRGEDGIVRCWWPGDHEDYCVYHDAEWGLPVTDDQRLFEKICLEGFQSGLSWLTILRKRENFRKAFSGFDVDKVARFDRKKVERLLQDAGIVRHRGKIESTINNAKQAKAVIGEFGSLAAFFWQYEPPQKDRPQKATHAALMKLSKTPTSTALSKELRRRGWSFVGPTTAYAFMQAMGLVNDHLEGCAMRPIVEKARRRFSRPA